MFEIVVLAFLWSCVFFFILFCSYGLYTFVRDDLLDYRRKLDRIKRGDDKWI